MKKFFKFLIAIVAICAGVAGGLFVYSKIREKNMLDDDFDDDDYDDDFSDDDDKEYVKITPDTEEATAEE